MAVVQLIPTAAAQAPTTQEAAPAPGLNLVSTPLSELKILLAPLDLETLESLREDLRAELRTLATDLAALLVEYQRLEAAKDTEERAKLDALLAEKMNQKAELVSRANVLFSAIEAKGGDVTAGRAYAAVIDALVLERPPAVTEETTLSPEEQAKAAVRAAAAELVAIVRAEPPVHERVNPWEVPVTELELELQPLTLEEIDKRLKAWQDILQREVRKRVRYDILLNNAEKLSATRAAAQAADGAAVEGQEIPEDALKAELADLSQAQQRIVRAIVERMNVAIQLLQRRGGDPKPYADYIASATGQKLNLYDPSVLAAQVRAWIFARDGGIKLGLDLLKFLGVLLAFWVLSVVLAWMTSAAVKRIPQASSLLRPLLVAGVRRSVQIIGVIIAITTLGVSAGPLLAIIGAAGLVIGLALQGTLSNFASGIMILINRPYDVGDAISAGGVVGKVEAMNLVSTQILTFDNQIMLVPNNEIWNGVITNITGRSTRRVDLTFGIAYTDDVGKATRILEEMLVAHPKVLSDPAPVVRVHELGDNSVNIIARPWAQTSDYWDVYWDMMRDVKLRFDEEGINIPFPQRELHLSGPIEVALAGADGGNGSTGTGGGAAGLSGRREPLGAKGSKPAAGMEDGGSEMRGS